MPGLLRLVATPIGNLGDLSERAKEALEQADLVACEDTRRTGRLLAHLGLKRPMVSVHEHNEAHRQTRILRELENGQTIALVSDAGTPLVSDPGFVLVRAAIEAGVRVEAVPGASALLAALVVSGLPPHPFTFLGFAPPKTGKRKTYLETHKEIAHTLVFYESPHRLLKFLADASLVLGDRQCALGRELTKLHEEVLRGTLGEVLQTLELRDSLKGEFVVVIEGARPFSKRLAAVP